MTGEPGKPGPMGIYKPGFNTYATKQSNLTFGGKTYNTYMDLCKDIKDDKDKIVGFLKQKDKELKKYQDSDVDYKKRKIEHEKAEADYRAQQEFRDTERAAMSEYHQALEDGSVNEEYAQERMKSKIEAADAELKAKQDLNSQYYEIDQDSLDKTLTERFGQERKPGNTLENTVGTDFRNEQRNDIQAKILGFGDADASNFGDNSDDNDEFIDENSPLVAPRTPEQICQDKVNWGNNVEEGDIKVTCTTDGKVAKDDDNSPQQQKFDKETCLQEISLLQSEVTEHYNKFEQGSAGKQTITSHISEFEKITSPCEDEVSKGNALIHLKNALAVQEPERNKENDVKCEVLTDDEVIACNEKDRSLVPEYNATLQECETNVLSGLNKETRESLKELNSIKAKCSATETTADATPQPADGAGGQGNLCAGIIEPDKCRLEPQQNPTKVIITARNSGGEEVEFSINGDNSIKATRSLFKVGRQTTFESSQEALYYLIGYFVHDKNEMYSSYTQVYDNESFTPPYDGVDTFNYCQRALGSTNWKDIIKSPDSRKRMHEVRAKAEFYKMLTESLHPDCRNGTKDDTDNKIRCIGYTLLTNSNGDNNHFYSDAIKTAADCEIFARVLKENFEEGRHRDDEYKNGGEKASMDGRLKCKVRSIENIDYDECSNIVNAYNAALVGKQGLGVVQQVQTQEATFDGNQRMQEAQFNAVNNIRNGTDKNNPIQRQVNGQMAAYQVQRDMINKQKSQAQTRAAIDTAAAASLVGLAQALPDKEYIVDTCLAEKNSTILSEIQNDLEKVIDGFQSILFANINYKKPTMDDYCKNRISEMNHDFIPNKLISQPVYAIAAEFGVEAAKNQLSASMLKKRAGMIDDLMERIKNMDTGGEYAGLTQQEAIMKYCEANPSSAQCAALPGGTGTTVINPGGFNLSGDDFSPNQLATNDTEDFGEDLDTVSEIDENGDGDGSTGPTSTKVADVNKNGEKGAIAPRAKIGNGGGRGPASGGGAGGAASAGNRGGGGAPEGEKGKAQASGQAKNTSLAYNSGKNNAYLKGGGSINSRSNKKVANPFAKLFKNSKGKVLNFRGPSSIGKQSGNLFTRISKRYGNVHENNRLLKYKYTPAK